jgi:hypothetical protein
MLWRLVLEGVATLEEIERHWSINDLYDAHEALDIRAEQEEWARANARK